jgi:hypothetical protein
MNLELLAVVLFNLVLPTHKVGSVSQPADATVALAPEMPPPRSTGNGEWSRFSWHLASRSLKIVAPATGANWPTL